MLLRTYNLLIPLAVLVARVLGGLFPKLRDTLEDRTGCLASWEAGMANVPVGKRVLFHVSSVGELEQVRPVLQHWQRRSDRPFVLSYFSPSVTKSVKDFSFVRFAHYLPLDTAVDMEKFFDTVQPEMIVLNRYDVWPNFLAEARIRKIPVALINASTPPLGFIGGIGLWLRNSMFGQIKVWTYVDAVAAEAWEPMLGKNAQGFVTGNPRVDQVLQRLDQAKAGSTALDVIRKKWLRAPERTIVAGSTWEADESLLIDTYRELLCDPTTADLQLVVVAHEPVAENVQRFVAQCRAENWSVVRYSELDSMAESNRSNILVVDAVGFLAELYSLGGTAYVGGGFGPGRAIHSIIEPAAHGLAVAFGPRHSRVPEAKALVLTGGACALRKRSDFRQLAQWFALSLPGEARSKRILEAISLFVKMHRGAGERVANYLDEQCSDVR